MDKKTLTSLFAEALYRIPDYQRGYAWEEKQWTDFIQDIDALVDEQVRSHYTGTVVVYADRDAPPKPYGIEYLHMVDVVDGQQRLTTVCLYLAAIIRALIQQGEAAYESAVAKYLYAGATCRLTLNNDTADIFYDLLKTGRPTAPSRTPHQQRLVAAHRRFQEHIDEQLTARGAEGVVYLRELYRAITQKLHFTFYTIEEESEIGMTFELMNSRGKNLSTLELLKNYLMHWVARNEPTPAGRDMLTKLINKSWKDTYTNLGESNSNEDQCLRVAWTLYCTHTPGNWDGYAGFKSDEYIPLRTFTKRSKDETKRFIVRFAEGLGEVSRHYAAVMRPVEFGAVSRDEIVWLTKIHRTGTIAGFLPLMVAARIQRVRGNVADSDYIALLKGLERYAYRVYLYEGIRSNAGQTALYRWGSELFREQHPIGSILGWLDGRTRFYSDEETFHKELNEPSDWYNKYWRCVRYTLFEYELHLLETEGQGQPPRLAWHEVADSTIEHILPQHPAPRSRWNRAWPPKQHKACVHDIGNLVLTQNNASYSNFEFERKRGAPGVSPSYSNSDIRQERKIAAYTDWTPATYSERRRELVAWIYERWKTEGRAGTLSPVVDDAPDPEEPEGELEEERV